MVAAEEVPQVKADVAIKSPAKAEPVASKEQEAGGGSAKKRAGGFGNWKGGSEHRGGECDRWKQGMMPV